MRKRMHGSPGAGHGFQFTFVKARRHRQIVGLLAWATLLAACANHGSGPIPVTGVTDGPVASPTPLVVTATPTALMPVTPASGTQVVCETSGDQSSVLAAAQTRLAALIPAAQVTWYDDFSCPQLGPAWVLGNTNPTTTVTLAEGWVTIRAQPVENIWDGIGRSASSLELGDGLLVQFEYEPETTAPLFVQSGGWHGADYLRTGLTINRDVDTAWQVWESFAFESFPLPAQVLRPNTPYYLLISLSRAGQMTMRVWEQAQPANAAEFQDSLPGRWSNSRWASMFQVKEGGLRLDEYFEFSQPP